MNQFPSYLNTPPVCEELLSLFAYLIVGTRPPPSDNNKLFIFAIKPVLKEGGTRTNQLPFVMNASECQSYWNRREGASSNYDDYKTEKLEYLIVLPHDKKFFLAQMIRRRSLSLENTCRCVKQAFKESHFRW